MPTDGPKSPTLAYEDESFLDGEDGRPVRILAEYLEPLHRFRRANIHDTVVFFGSARLSSDGPLARYYREARELSFEFHYFFMRKLWFAEPDQASPSFAHSRTRESRDP